MCHFLQIMIARKLHHFSRKTLQFLVITKWRTGPLSANYNHKKNQTISQEKPYNFSWSRIAEIGHFLQITIAKKNSTISQEKLYNFSWSQIAEYGHFLRITIARKTRPFLKKHYTISADRKLQNRPTFCKFRLQEKLDHFSRKLNNFSWSQIAEYGHFLQIMIARETLPFLKKNYTIPRDREMQKWATFCKLLSQEKPDNF